MSITVKRENVFFSFSPANQAVVHVKQGDTVRMETHDCFEGQIRSVKDLITNLDWDHVNPATGPVYIEDTHPGDILRVDLLKLDVDSQSCMVVLPGEGTLGGSIKQLETAILKSEGDELVFKDKIRVPKHPMIGVIGVSPAQESIPNGTPGLHGGNMDCTLIGEGSRVYFSVAVEGALFGAGDMHAAMGDGEIVICGAETAGEIQFNARVVDLKGLPTPFVETPDLVATIFSAEDVAAAAQGAIERMADFLTNIAGLPINDAGMLMSLVGQIKFCQVVDPLKTVRFEFPKYVLKQFGFEMPA